MPERAAPITFGTVCSGIGAPEEAVAPLGWRCVWQAEIERHPARVLAARHPAPNLGDMTTIAARVLAGEVEAPDVLIGGTPCQDFSVAGLRAGLDGERGNLSIAFVRLADAIDVVRRRRWDAPCVVLWENVPGILSDKRNAFGAILGGLVGADAALVPSKRWSRAGVVDGPSRRAGWRILDAQHFGLAQRRERVFVVARGGAGDWTGPDALLPLVESVRWHPAPRRQAREAVAGDAASGAGGCGQQGVAFGGNNTSGPIDVSTALNAHGGPCGRLDFESETFVAHTLRGHSDYGDGLPCLRAKGGDAAGGSESLIAHTLRGEGFDASEDGIGRGTPLVPVAYRTSGNCGAYATGDRTDALTTGTDQSATVLAFDTTQITSPSNYSNPRPDQPCHPLAAGAHAPAIIANGVRRLTPTECERLQGFPDGYTALPGLADGPRYRMLGNSMAVPVMRYIASQINNSLQNSA